MEAFRADLEMKKDENGSVSMEFTIITGFIRDED